MLIGGDIIITILSALLWLGCIFYLAIGVYIYRLDKKSKINTVFLKLNIFFSIWSSGYAIMLVSSNEYSAFFWCVISGFGYSTFIGYWLYFTYLFDNQNSKKYNLAINLIGFSPLILFVIKNIMTDPSKAVVKTQYGWSGAYQLIFLNRGFNIISAVVYILGIVVIIFKVEKSHNNRAKKQAKIIFITSVFAYIVDLALLMNSKAIFPSGIITAMGSLAGIYYAIRKYKMLTITPKFISEYIFNTVNEPIFILNGDYVVKYCNTAALNLTKHSYEDLRGRFFNSLIQEESFDFEDLIKAGYSKNVEIKLKKKDGNFFECELSSGIISDEYNDTLGIAVLLYDISERKRAQEIEKNYIVRLQNEIKDRIRAEKQIKHFLYYDALTELPNRKNMLERINVLAENKNEEFAVMFMDLDGFKNINDNFGHQVGDYVLKCVADKIRNIIGIDDTIHRIGGDEFVIILGKLISKSYIEEIAEKIQEILKEPIVHNGENMLIGASIGVSVFPEHGLDSDTLIKNADLAMYEVKENGGYGYTIYSTKMNDKLIDKLKMKVRLREAIENNEFISFYQPIIDVNLMKVLNAEGLIRWQRDGRIVPPIEFIPIAKSVGEIVAIDNWMLENACIQCKKWHELGAEDLCVSVNVSYTQLQQLDFVSIVKCILEAYDLPARYLNLEITEDEAMEAPETIIRILTELKNIGVQISLDDFGTGYSSFSYINKLPIDKIKIDRSLIMNLQDDYKNIMIVKAIIQMAHSLNIKIVAEGIETEEQFNILKELECDLIQGYFIGRPMSSNEFEINFIDTKEMP